ncbi:hypothetical protein CJP55_04000 [Lactobacillus plantarum]|nr:hypothetical protein [Lactiplantibacillus plantarum]
MAIKQTLKKISLVRTGYQRLKLGKRLTNNFTFENRSTGSDQLIIIIAGYKPFTWDNVMLRIKRFAPKNADVCIASSGKYSERLSKIAKKNNWSYMSTKRNNVSLLQNVVINAFSRAQMIFKVDEDIFITQNTFESMLGTYQHVAKSSDIPYVPGFVAPLIPINGYAHVRVVEKLGIKAEFERKFGALRYAAGPDRPIESDVNVAKFFWGVGNYVPSIDEMSAKFAEEQFSYSVCPVRFSIGCIVFKRDFWDEINMFEVGHGNAMGLDEEQVDAACLIKSKPIIVDENTVVGHLSFGIQNNVMKEFYLNHVANFSIDNHKVVAS